MKLHLPVRLFRAVMALFPLVVSTISQPLYAEAPDDAVEVILIDEDALRADIPTPLLGNDVEFWYFSDSPELSILSEATSSVFVAEEEPCLAFEELGYSENSVAVTDISGDVSTLTLSDNGSMTNMSRSYTEDDSDALTLSSNGSVMTETSRAYEVDEGGTLALNGKGSLMFSNHVLSYGAGGAIYGGSDVTITMRDNESVSFIGNSSGGSGNGGGAIYAYTSTITLSDNKSVLFSGNSSRSSGGAICGGKGKQGTCALTLSGNRSVTFRENSASNGGAINTGAHSTITLNDNESVLFSGNSASGDGGAINAENNSTIILSNNKSVTFSGNSAGNCGGAIVGFYSNTIQLNYNENVTFSENSSGTGGAIYFQGSAELIGNETVTFSGNSAGTGIGGAIDGSFFSGALSRITLSNNGIVTFSGNSASSGGAIWYVGSLNIRNNDYVLFEKNVEKSNSNYRLNSICTLDEYATISLSAAEGASIEFRDSVYMGSGNIMYLNGEYGGIKQTGDIIFTGKYTETHLNEILEADGAERLATAEEIRLSRTTEVYATTYLYGGRLRIEDGAVYKGNGIIAESGSASTVLVKDAVLSHAGYELYFGEGTTLELTGNNSISGNIDMSIGSSLRLNAGTSLGLTDIIGDLYIGGGMTLALSNDAEWRCENGVLLYVTGDLTGWDADTLTVTGAGTYNSSDVSWVGNLLVLNYNAETFNRYFRGSTSIGRLSYPCEYRNFSEIYTEAGFSQPAEYSNSINIIDNGRVTFNGITTSDNGGAINSAVNLKIQNNESVLFQKNAEIKNGVYQLRSIYAGGSGNVISLSAAEDGSIEFRDSVYIGSGNTVNLNKKYGDIEQTGDILFTGAYTEADLLAVKGSAGTAAEILNSRTTEVYAMTNLYGGRLRVEDGAIYKGYGITAMEGSAATVLVKDAVLSHDGYDLTFHSGTSLELTGNNSIIGNIDMHTNSTLLLNATEAVGLTDIVGHLNTVGGVTLALSNDSTWRCENGVLLYVAGDLTGWEADTLTVTGAGTYGSSDVSWVGNLLVLNYNAETFDRYFNGVASKPGNLMDSCAYHHFSEISFTDYTEYGNYVDKRIISLTDNGRVTFSGNSSDDGAIYVGDDSMIMLNNNDSVTFSGNSAINNLGALVAGRYSTITISDNGSVTFSGNVADSDDWDTYGGAIYGVTGSTITISDNGSVTFSENTSDAASGYDAMGGVIHGSGSTITLSGNDSVTFNGNTASGASAYGGAIEVGNCTITLSANGSVTFNGNTASGSYAYGGAIYGGDDSTIELSGNGSVTFSGNTASAFSSSPAYGGAIYGGKSSTITLSGNESVTFSGNTASSSSDDAYGGAIYGRDGSTIELSGNDSVEFSGNSASSSSAAYAYAYGGAICGSTIELSGNGSVEFSGNTASSSSSSSYGGAIYGGTIELSGNGSVEFSGNTASSSSSSSARGGAIYGSTIELNSNGSVTFSGNTASSSSSFSYGGAIYGYGNLNIRNNDSVLFEKNAEISGATYRLRSIYAGGSGDVISLSAAAGKSIEFRDSVYIASDNTVNLNADYTDAEGVVHKQTGDIIFTGKYTEQHLNELLASDGLSRTATESEILYSRTSVVSSVINLYGGRLRVEDGAVLDCAGLIAAEGSAATLRVKDAELSHAGYDITLASGTTLEAEGVNAVAASRLVMQEGSTLRFVLNEDNLSAAALTLDGELSLNGSVSLVLNEGLASGRYSLMTYTGLSGDTSQLRAELPEEYELVWDDSSTDVIVWRQVTLPEEAAEWTENHTYTRAVADTDVIYDSVSLNGGIYEVSGSGSLGVGGILSVTGGADVMVDVDTMALGVEVGDDSRLDLRKSLNLVSVMRLSGDETEYTEAISVGRNAVLLLTDASLLGQVAVADESSELYYQTTAGDKLLKFTGDMGDGGLNLTTDESGTKVYAADSAGFAGNITVLSGATLVNAASSANDGVPFGENYAANANRSITVQKDAVLDINGRETYYRVVLEEGAVLTNGGADVHESWKGLPVIDLTGDAEVNAAAQICMVGGSYATNYLNLNGHKLSKTGADCLILRKTDISAGTLAVNEGLLYFMGSTSFASGTSVEVNNGGTLWIPETTGSYAGKLTVNAGGRVYLGEGPNGTLDGDLVTDNRSIDLSTLSEVALSGGTLTFRGGSLALGEVAVTADSTLEIWDQGGSSGMVATASTIETLDAGAALNLATTWKSHLNINVLKGAGSLTVGSSREQHRVEVQDMRAYTGSFAVNGSQSTLVLNLAKEYVLSAGRVTKDADSTLLLHGEGAYDIGTEKALAAGVTLAEDWIGSVRLTGATLSGDTLAGLSNAASTVELHGVSGYLSRADAQGGTQTYTANLKLTDNGDTAAWDLNNGYNGDVRVFSGDISGTGTLKRSSYKGTNQTLIFTGDAGGWTGAIDHAPNSGKNSGAVVSTNVTFSGTKELNVEMRTNGKGELNVTLDDEHLAAGSKVKVNGRIGADSLTVTEGTVAQLQNEAAVTRLAVAGAAELGAAGSVQHGEGTQLVSREEADLALLFGVESTETQIIGLHAESALQNISITAGSAYLMQNLALDNVSFSATDAALTLRGVTFSGDCSFSVGESGSILLDAATLTVVLPELAGHEDGVLRLDYSNLFHCVASGQLDIALDTDSLMEEGYHSITFDFGDDVDYSRLSLKLEGASYSGSSAGVAHFSLSVPEPTSTALSLLALAGLAARRRRK